MGNSVKMLIMVAMFISLASMVIAVPVTIDKVKVNGDEVLPSGSEVRSLDRNNEFDVKVFFTADADAEDTQVEVMMRGYDHDDLIDDITDVFDVKDGVSYVKTLHLELPQRMDSDDTYYLRVIIADRHSELVQENYVIYVDSNRHSVMIKDVLFSPENEVKTGRALLGTVRLKNYGKKDEESIKIQMSIPDLGISASDYIDKLDAGDSVTSEELYLRIPMCTAGGDYAIQISISYDDGDETQAMTKSIRVVEDESCGATQPVATEEKTFVTAPGSQDVTKGTTGAVYPVLLTNAGSTAKTYSFKLNGVETFGTYRIEPSAVMVVPAGKTETVYLYISANDEAVEGESAFFVEINSGTDKKMLPLTANVVAGEEAAPEAAGWDRVKRGLEIGLVVLVVLLVILGLIIGFNKLKGNDEEDDSAGQTYY